MLSSFIFQDMVTRIKLLELRFNTLQLGTNIYVNRHVPASANINPVVWKPVLLVRAEGTHQLTL